ncbi:MAG: AbrB/MazE/SpoVT family DNA-binding domain-containing protein [Acidobacteria bacterium]|nr:AbrB/MazE/SpoVT family DNA-binding domain-containing protein [Acidobacteriota bacterium]
MKLTSKCQVTVPLAVREKLGLFPGSEVEFIVDGKFAKLVKAKKKKGTMSRGERIVARAIGKGTVNRDLSTDQIMAWTRGWGEDDFDR